MKTKLKLLLLLFVTVKFLLSPLATYAAYDQAAAQNYILAHANNPWSTMALAALNYSSIPNEYLKSVSGTSATDYEASILAITALNRDPRTFGGADYVEKLKSFYSNGQIGDANTLNDDMFGVLALVSAGEQSSDPVISSAKNFILAHQNPNGSWGFTIGSQPDSNMTAAGIVSLIGAGASPGDDSIQRALNYLKTAQNDDGGFAYAPGAESDSSSTSWVMWALNAVGIDPTAWTKSGRAPTDYLESNQTASGYFKYQSGSSEDSFSAVTTAYAVIALADKTLPLHIASNTTQTFPFRIEGNSSTVCQGKATGPTALDIVKNASLQCGFTYNVKSTSYGPYLNIIDNDEASGTTGWMYFVDNVSPSVGADSYTLKPGDEVLWYFGDFGWQPARITLSSTEINSGQTVPVTAESFNGNSWQPLPDADVLFGASSAKTDSNGQAQLAPPDGYYKVYAQKEGFVRTDSIMLKVGQPQSGSVNLNANIDAGKVKGDSTSTPGIAFTVGPSSLDFGLIKPGDTAVKSLTLHNTGTSNIRIAAIVSGDSLFMDNLQVKDASWRTFKENVTSGASQEENVKLSVPSSFYDGGQKRGQLIFWATSN